ncbi:MAG TPA: PqqD family protein [Bacteroidales bacterium]|nr:PqqD family protein [Bacteroidales bacterium]
MVKKVGYFARRRILKNANFLDLTPVPLYGHEMDQHGHAIILVPRFQGFLTRRLLQPRLKNPYIKLELDEPGTATWLMLNGKNKVREICTELRSCLQEKIEPAEDRVTRFLSQLYNQKLIAFNEILKSERYE